MVKQVFDQSSIPFTEENIRHSPGLNPVHEALANIRLKSFQLLAEKTPDNPDIEPKVARAHSILGMITFFVGSFQSTEQHLTKAAQLYGQLAQKSSGNSRADSRRVPGVARARLALLGRQPYRSRTSLV